MYYKTTFKHKSVLVAVLKGSYKLFTVHLIYFSATASLLHKNSWYTLCLMPSFLQLLRWDLMPIQLLMKRMLHPLRRLSDISWFLFL